MIRKKVKHIYFKSFIDNADIINTHNYFTSYSEFFKLKNEFNHIGNNLNQIARALNNRQDISLKTIMETIKELRQMIKNLDEKVRG